MILKGIWNSEYVTTLGILDHCKELEIINNEIRRLKNKTEQHCVADIGDLQRHFEEECMDLYILLSKKFDMVPNKYSNLFQKRFIKFEKKAAEEQ